MKLLEMLIENPGLMGQLSKTAGLGSGDTRSAVESLLPALARGLGNNASRPGGLESLLGALKSGQHQRYVDHPEEIERRETVDDGNGILGHILGSKEVSRNVAGRASRETGIDSGILKKMLPLVASMAMGALAKQTSGGGELSSLGGGRRQSGAPDLLTSFLDAEKDGSVVDDVLRLAKRFF